MDNNNAMNIAFIVGMWVLIERVIGFQCNNTRENFSPLGNSGSMRYSDVNDYQSNLYKLLNKFRNIENWSK